jgi:AcrR family transcriptional regulator
MFMMHRIDVRCRRNAVPTLKVRSFQNEDPKGQSSSPDRAIGTPKRQTQEERSEGTQQRIISAAIEILYDEGYVAATTHSISARAGVSRGAMLHHFPSKDDLMLAVVRIAHERDSMYMREGLTKISDPLERYFALPDLAWEVMSGPAGIAVLEIMMSSRSNSALAKRLAPLQSEIESQSQERIVQLMQDAGLRREPISKDFANLAVAAIRGFSIEAMFHKDTKRITNSLKSFKTLIRQYHKRNAAG